MAIEKSMEDKESLEAKLVVSLKDLWPFLKPYRLQVGIAFVLLCLSSAALLLVPLAFRDLIDVGFGESNGPAPCLLYTSPSPRD